MTTLDTQVLPLLPLTTGVVLPGMVVTLTIESDDARRAVAAAENTDGELLLVPRFDERFAQVGTVAKVEDVGQLRNGLEALVIRGLQRAVVSRRRPRDGRRDLGPGRRAPRSRGRRARALGSSPASTADRSRTSSRRAACRRSPSSSAASATPAQIADTAGYSPDLSFEQKVEVLETLDVEQRLEKVLGWAKESLAEVELKDKIRTDVSEGMEKTPARVPAAPADGRDPQGARRGRRRGRRRRSTATKIAEPRTCPRTRARRPSASSAASSGRPSSPPSTAGSAPTSTG